MPLCMVLMQRVVVCVCSSFYPPHPTVQVRQGLKKYSNWPTYPQLYSNGNLIGGLDIVKVRSCV